MPPERSYVFPPFRLDVVNECLWRDERQISLRSKPFAVLRCLLEHAGQLVTKDVLFRTVWPDVYVSEVPPAGMHSRATESVRGRRAHPPVH